MVQKEKYPLQDIAKHFKVLVSKIYNAITAAGFSEFRAKSSRFSHSYANVDGTTVGNPNK